MTARWTNWGRTQSCAPAAIDAPRTEEEIQRSVALATGSDQRVKAVGTGHSFTDVACTDGRLLKLDGYDRVLEADASTGRVTVQAGITIAKLNRELGRRGLALENLGDIAYQTISGAISTGTHGTGAGKPGIAPQVVGLSMVLADGSVLRCSAVEEPRTFAAAQVGLGALGVISTVTLRCVPDFNLHSVEEPRRLDEVLERFEELSAANDHFEFFWFPHTDVVQTVTNNRTEAEARPKGAVAAYLDDVVLENHAFGLVQRLGRARPSWIPGLARFTGRMLSRGEVVDRSDRVFANERLVRFAEMEYAIPRQNAVAAVREVRAMIQRTGLRVGFPIEVRVLAGDQVPLSMAYGRESAFIAVHVYWRQAYERYFREVEAIMDGFEGRPHWGKLHFQTGDTLRPRYPLWDSFLEVRDRLDPERLFSNPYLEKVLGP